MSTVKINNKNYEVPEFTFRHSKLLEQYGVSLRNIANPDCILTVASAFVAIVTNTNVDTADYLIEQHILGGGSLEGIYQAYVEALSKSDFFKKILGTTEETEKKPKGTQKKLTVAENE